MCTLVLLAVRGHVFKQGATTARLMLASVLTFSDDRAGVLKLTATSSNSKCNIEQDKDKSKHCCTTVRM
jgi:hypothetical protein